LRGQKRVAEIVRRETFANERVCYARLTSREGAVGCDQTSINNADIAATVVHRQVAPFAIRDERITIARPPARTVRFHPGGGDKALFSVTNSPTLR
jgi:hypothetical protein